MKRNVYLDLNDKRDDKMVKEFTVKRSEWLRGEGPDVSYLYRNRDGLRCCLGFLGNACGVSDSQMEGAGGPGLVEDKDVWPKSLIDRAGTHGHSHDCDKIMVLNDREELSDYEREKKLTDAFTVIGIKINFVD